LVSTSQFDLKNNLFTLHAAPDSPVLNADDVHQLLPLATICGQVNADGQAADKTAGKLGKELDAAGKH